MNENLPNLADVDPDTIAAPVLTRHGWVTPSPDSLIALRKLQTQIAGLAPSGGRNVLAEDAFAMAARLRKKYEGDPARLAELDTLTQP